MRILHVSNKFPPDIVGGAELLVEKLAAGSAERGHEVLVLTSRKKRGPAVVKRHGNVEVVEVWPGTGIIPPRDLPRLRELIFQVPVHLYDIFNPSVTSAFRKAARRFRPHVLHTHNLYGLSLGVWSAARTAGIPVVHTAHDCHLICPKGIIVHGEDPLAQAGRLAGRLYCRRYMSRTALVDILCAPTHHHARLHAAHGCKAARVAVVPNSLTDAVPARAEREHGSLNILYLGQLEPHKGIDVLVETLRLLPAGTVRFSFAGGGSREGILREIARSRTDVSVHGVVRGDRKEQLLRRADLLVFPSLCLESYGLSVSEALQHGIPAVVTDIGGQRELVEEGETGFLVSPGDARALAELLLRLVREPGRLHAMGESARERSTRYLAGDMVTRYEELYSFLANPSSAFPAGSLTAAEGKDSREV